MGRGWGIGGGGWDPPLLFGMGRNYVAPPPDFLKWIIALESDLTFIASATPTLNAAVSWLIFLFVNCFA